MSAMGSHTNKMSQKKDRPQIIKLNKALELAQKWVNDMTEPAEDEHFEIQSRPARLGLGAKVPRPSKFVPSDDPLERKLHYKLDAGRRAAAKIAEESAAATASAASDDDDDEDLDSRTKAFEKKRPAAPVTPSLGGKKRKKMFSQEIKACGKVVGTNIPHFPNQSYGLFSAKEDLLLIGEMLLLILWIWMHIYDWLSNCLNQKVGWFSAWTISQIVSIRVPVLDMSLVTIWSKVGGNGSGRRCQ
ncbi:unnamed protein product [Prunus armeniaca]|uniref:Uncharacterized protein n=1 Tax=Prunus armeniaca TaxID=36596 RepID=A0A6J5TJE4_PRUAR|nr:unnamed protein product [Prunus armeniaca]